MIEARRRGCRHGRCHEPRELSVAYCLVSDVADLRSDDLMRRVDGVDVVCQGSDVSVVAAGKRPLAVADRLIRAARFIVDIPLKVESRDAVRHRIDAREICALFVAPHVVARLLSPLKFVRLVPVRYVGGLLIADLMLMTCPSPMDAS